MGYGGQPVRIGFRSLVIVAVMIAAGFFAYDRFFAKPARERQESLDLAKTLTETFSKQAALKVATLSGEVRASANDSRFYGLLQSRQTLIAPYSVDYIIDLRKLGPRDFRYDQSSDVLTVRLPEPIPAKPAVDWAQSRLMNREGVWVTNAAVDDMGRRAALGMSESATRSAAKATYIESARKSGEDLIVNLLSTPLQLAGRANTKVKVSFALQGGGVRERWDESSSLAAVIANATH